MMHPAAPDSLLQSIFDALPSLVFIVDGDVRIQQCNAAAADLLRHGSASFLEQRAGDALHCLYSMATPQGCGHSSHCGDCVIRNSVRDASAGHRVVRRRTRMQLFRAGAEVEVYALATASPFIWQDRALVLLVLEDISELAEIQRFLPICCVCKKVRTDSESWMRIESYFKSRWDVQLSHGYCPECLETERSRMLRDHASGLADPSAWAGQP